MCGIIGYVGSRPAGPTLLEGLQRLEYRGYDSSGIAILDKSGELVIEKAVGKLSTLISSVEGNCPVGYLGIGHTRWATHGKPTDSNAHPHIDCSGNVAVIHNGIVENYMELKAELLFLGHEFRSQTDTEVLPHLIEHFLKQGADLETALREAIKRIKGAHAIIALCKQEPDRIVGARIGNAGGLVVGYGKNEMYIASDLPAILPYTRDMVFLSSLETVILTAAGASYSTADGDKLRKTPQTTPYDMVAAAKGGYKHFMLKEIMEQPEAVTDAIRGRVEFEPPNIYLEDMPFTETDLQAVKKVVIVACGTSMYAALVAKFMIEDLARIPTEVDYGSEYRYREPIIDPSTLVISVGQSGETVDTLAAMEEAKRQGSRQITVCNVVGSQATRVADAVVYIRAGIEIGVAATKTFTASLTALYLLATYLAKARGLVDNGQLKAITDELARLPDNLGRVLEGNPIYEKLAHQYFRCSNFLFLGRNINYPIALEGALKLKEISYIHAEGYPAGEMKHGPIALIDENLPVVAIALKDKVYDKMVSNIEQVKARDGIVIALATEGDKEMEGKADHVIYIPQTSHHLSPILSVVPLQLLAYHIAVRRGCDVDQPRNLAKSVTVE